MADAWGVSFGGTFIVWETSEQVTLPSFGPPFLDRQCALLATVGASTPLITVLGTHNPMTDTIERQNLLRSSRIDRSLL